MPHLLRGLKIALIGYSGRAGCQMLARFVFLWTDIVVLGWLALWPRLALNRLSDPLLSSPLLGLQVRYHTQLRLLGASVTVRGADNIYYAFIALLSLLGFTLL